MAASKFKIGTVGEFCTKLLRWSPLHEHEVRMYDATSGRRVRSDCMLTRRRITSAALSKPEPDTTVEEYLDAARGLVVGGLPLGSIELRMYDVKGSRIGEDTLFSRLRARENEAKQAESVRAWRAVVEMLELHEALDEEQSASLHEALTVIDSGFDAKLLEYMTKQEKQTAKSKVRKGSK